MNNTIRNGIATVNCALFPGVPLEHGSAKESLKRKGRYKASRNRAASAAISRLRASSKRS
jgi:hypothetical protein